ncbi:MAG TPA: hypothetical protein VHE99_01770 [Gammaproteobacteria bacterium]|nr:hypothetical protein [Gammaproteobacteria bacterium]
MEKKKEKKASVDDGKGFDSGQAENKQPTTKHFLGEEKHAGDMDEASQFLIEQILQEDVNKLEKKNSSVKLNYEKKEKKERHRPMPPPLSENLLDNEMWLIAELVQKVESLATKVGAVQKQQTDKKLTTKSFSFITDKPMLWGIWSLPILEEVEMALAGAYSKQTKSLQGQELLRKTTQNLAKIFQELCSIVVAELKKELHESNLDYLQKLSQAGQKLFIFGTNLQKFKVIVDLKKLSQFTASATSLVNTLKESKNALGTVKNSGWSFSSILDIFSSNKELNSRISVSNTSSSASVSSSSSSSISSSRSSQRRVTFAAGTKADEPDEQEHKKLTPSSALWVPPTPQSQQKKSDTAKLTIVSLDFSQLCR